MITKRCISLHVSAGRTAGVIIDTPPSFASSSSGEHRNNLIRACIESFKGLPLLSYSRLRSCEIALTDRSPSFPEQLTLFL